MFHFLIYELNSKIHIGTTTESSYKLDVNAGAAGGISVSNAAAVLSLNLYNSTNNAIARFTSTTNAFWDLQANTDGTFQIDRSDISVLTFATTGAATFSNSVTAVGTISSSSGSGSGITLANGSIYTSQANSEDDILVNFVGYNGGTTQNRNFRVYDGKSNVIFRTFGGSKNVAIGSNSDAGYKLYVSGQTIAINNATTAEFRLQGGGYGTSYNTSLRSLAGAIGVLQFGNNDANYVLIGNTATGGYLDFRSNVSGESVSSGNFAMRINANGNIGINSTNSSEKLYVNGKILGVGKLFIQRESAGADTLIQFKNEVGSDRAYINFGGTNEELGFYSGAGGTRNMIIGSDGAMGFNYPTLAVRSFMFRAISGRPLAIEIAESGGVQSVYIRPNSSGRHLITSNYLSGGVYLPLALSGRENDGDLVLATSGNILINTGTDSGWKLYVNGGSTDALKLYNSGGVQSMNIENTTNNVIMRLVSSTNTFWDIQANTNGTFHIDRGDVTAFLLATSGAATFSSSVTATSFFESSDIRLKTLIESNPIIDGIEKLQAKLYEKNGKIEMGYFAQDAEKLMPYAVEKNEDGFLNLSYREVHTAKIARLEKRVAELEKQLNLN